MQSEDLGVWAAAQRVGWDRLSGALIRFGSNKDDSGWVVSTLGYGESDPVTSSPPWPGRTRATVRPVPRHGGRLGGKVQTLSSPGDQVMNRPPQ